MKTKKLKAELIEQVVKRIADRSGDGTIVRSFVEHYFRDVVYEDMTEMSLEDLCGSALSILRFAHRLEPGETKTVNLNVRAKDLAYYDVGVGDWVVEHVPHQILVGSSSRDLPSTAMIDVLP